MKLKKKSNKKIPAILTESLAMTFGTAGTRACGFATPVYAAMSRVALRPILSCGFCLHIYSRSPVSAQSVHLG